MRAGGDVRPTDTYGLAVQVGRDRQVQIEIRVLVSITPIIIEIGPVEVASVKGRVYG